MRKNLPLSGTHAGSPWRVLAVWLMVAVVVACQSPTAPSPAPKVERQPIPDGPVLLRDDIQLRKVTYVGGGYIRLARNPVNGEVYLLHPSDGLYRVTLAESASKFSVASVVEMVADGVPAGMAFGPDGALFVVANRQTDETHTQAVIRKGLAAASGRFTWATLASTEPYPMSNTQFDHLFNGIVVSPDGQWVFVNSGSRTDHGEVQSSDGAFPEAREAALTAKIFRLPANAVDLALPNDETASAAQGLVFARGTRNAYDPAFAPNGELFVGDNGPDADYPDELNWIREGQHYGFPWRFGNQDNPQQFADYDSRKDMRLSSDFMAVKTGTYGNDPGFPEPPGPFADPVINLGPDAMRYRGEDGKEYDAYAEGKPLHTFTPHRSPLGLVFITAPTLPADLRGEGNVLSAFLLSWGAAGGTLTDQGQDLLHLRLTKQGDNYASITTQIARDFKNPIDAVMIENRLYVLEFSPDGAIWELAFK